MSASVHAWIRWAFVSFGADWAADRAGRALVRYGETAIVEGVRGRRIGGRHLLDSRKALLRHEGARLRRVAALGHDERAVPHCGRTHIHHERADIRDEHAGSPAGRTLDRRGRRRFPQVGARSRDEGAGFPAGRGRFPRDGALSRREGALSRREGACVPFFGGAERTRFRGLTRNRQLLESIFLRSRLLPPH